MHHGPCHSSHPPCLSGTSYFGPRAYSTSNFAVNHASKLLKETHIPRCARPISRQRATRVRLRLSIFACLGSEVFLSSLQSWFFIEMLEIRSFDPFSRARRAPGGKNLLIKILHSACSAPHPPVRYPNSDSVQRHGVCSANTFTRHAQPSKIPVGLPSRLT